MADFAPGEAT